MNTGKCIWRAIADGSAVLALGLSLFITFRIFPNRENLTFDYQAILVGILAGLFTLIVGWNIYQMVDWNEKIQRVLNEKQDMESKMDSIETTIKQSENYLHNKSNYNQTLTYCFLSQNIAVSLTDKGKESQKEQMLNYGITALIQFSNYPDCKKESQSLLDTLVTAMQCTENIHVDAKQAIDMLMLCGRIKGYAELNNFDTFVSLIQKNTVKD